MTATVRPLPGRKAIPAVKAPRLCAAVRLPHEVRRVIAPHPAVSPPQAIEPQRLKRIARRRPCARLDLYGLTQTEARDMLVEFVVDCSRRSLRDALIITGKGTLGDGVLRRRVPEWLAEPPFRPLVAGLSWARQHHGGEGALYVALKHRPGVPESPKIHSAPRRG